MKSFENKGIKDIISEFPEVGNILEEYGIGCGPCTIGICQLKNILDIHKMDTDKEQELMSRIEAIIYPERKIKTHTVTNTKSTTETTQLYSPPLQKLVDEHVLIKRWLALIPAVVENLDLKNTMELHVVETGIDFIRSYADELHHAKEEDILFKYFDDTAEIFQVIYEDHKQARNHVIKMIAAIESSDESSLGHHLTAYGALLAEHIKKEDEILFPWLDRKLSPVQVIELAEKFNLEDQKIGRGAEKYNVFLNGLEKKFKREIIIPEEIKEKGKGD